MKQTVHAPFNVVGVTDDKPPTAPPEDPVWGLFLHSQQARLSATQVAVALGIASSTYSNWKKRGLPQEVDKIQKVADFLGKTIRGVSPQTRPLDAGSMPEGVALDHVVSYKHAQTLQLVTLEMLMRGEQLGDDFVFPLPDGALAPKHPAGRLVAWSKTRTPTFGDGLLLRDKSGEIHVREMRQGNGGRHFFAAPLNTGFKTLDSEVHGLVIIAVWNGLLGTGLQDT